ncbi:GNAT family protein [Leucobacter iarius]|uniref:GNAT family N-acetyltransferase n=1 Tax=Leucobacter iarius TaxID=333963 RepID=A0ABP4XQI3_9MICO
MLDPSLLPLADDRVVLRRLTDADAPAFAAGSADAAVREYAHLPEPEYTAESVRAMIAAVTDPMLDRGELAVLSLARRDSNAFAGSLVLFDVLNDRAEVGFWLHPDARGAGRAVAALALAARFAAGSGLTCLTARTALDNSASQRTLEAGGFARIGDSEGTTPSGQRMVSLHYELSLDSPAKPAP